MVKVTFSTNTDQTYRDNIKKDIKELRTKMGGVNTLTYAQIQRQIDKLEGKLRQPIEVVTNE